MHRSYYMTGRQNASFACKPMEPFQPLRYPPDTTLTQPIQAILYLPGTTIAPTWASPATSPPAPPDHVHRCKRASVFLRSGKDSGAAAHRSAPFAGGGMVSHALHLHGGQPGQGHSPPRRGGSTPALMRRSDLFQRENGMGCRPTGGNPCRCSSDTIPAAGLGAVSLPPEKSLRAAARNFRQVNAPAAGTAFAPVRPAAPAASASLWAGSAGQRPPQPPHPQNTLPGYGTRR